MLYEGPHDDEAFIGKNLNYFLIGILITVFWQIIDLRFLMNAILIYLSKTIVEL
jgi:hypothetical protein